jgi:uncharacterized protein
MDGSGVISRFELEPVQRASARGEKLAMISLDLGRTTCQVRIEPHGVLLPDGRCLTREEIEEICASELGCFRIEKDAVEAIATYSEISHRTFSLMATGTSPAMLISGFVMHRIRDVTPQQGSVEMVRALGKLHGRVLDTTTGLGYAAIEAARLASEVITIELDAAARKMAEQNPWSRELFSLPNIQLLLGGSHELIHQFAEGEFAAVVHDPPAINVAGELYSLQFYQQVHRVLGRRGRLFHYIGDPGKKSGFRTTSGVLRRLTDAGFSRVEKAPRAFGVVAYK